MMTELLAHGNDRVVRAMSGALRNLAIDARNKDLLGETGQESFLFCPPVFKILFEVSIHQEDGISSVFKLFCACVFR